MADRDDSEATDGETEEDFVPWNAPKQKNPKTATSSGENLSTTPDKAATLKDDEAVVFTRKAPTAENTASAEEANPPALISAPAAEISVDMAAPPLPTPADDQAEAKPKLTRKETTVVETIVDGQVTERKTSCIEIYESPSDQKQTGMPKGNTKPTRASAPVAKASTANDPLPRFETLPSGYKVQIPETRDNGDGTTSVLMTIGEVKRWRPIRPIAIKDMVQTPETQENGDGTTSVLMTIGGVTRWRPIRRIAIADLVDMPQPSSDDSVANATTTEVAAAQSLLALYDP